MASFASIVTDFNLQENEDYKNLENHDWCRSRFRNDYTVLKQQPKEDKDRLVEGKMIIQEDNDIIVIYFMQVVKIIFFLLNGMMERDIKCCP